MHPQATKTSEDNHNNQKNNQRLHNHDPLPGKNVLGKCTITL